MNAVLIFLVSLLIPASRPCLSLINTYQTETAITCFQNLPSLKGKLKFANFFIRSSELENLLQLENEFEPFLPHLEYLLGQKSPTSYLVLLQNNHEMRANGGFFGSYAVATLDKGIPNVRFQDIYVPDGALPGHVEPPKPIQESFEQGWFKLRDADWEPDFTVSAKTIRWFFEKGDEINPDFLVTLNLDTIEKIFGLLGEVYVPEYDLKLTSENLYTLLQNKAEIDFFPGSTQKKDVITAAGRSLTKKLETLSPSQYLAVANLLLDQLKQANLLVNAKDSSLQSILESKDWAGKLNLPDCQLEACLVDNYLLVEANMGANKANCCTDRVTIHTVTKAETEINHLVNVTFTNSSVRENPLPPRFYGGNYISYLRFYIPENATNLRLTAQPTLPKTLLQYPSPFDGLKETDFDQVFKYGLREIGLFHLTAAGTKSAVQISYSLPLTGDPKNYQLTVLKQHGLEKSPQEVNLFGKNTTTNLTTDYQIRTQL